MTGRSNSILTLFPFTLNHTVTARYMSPISNNFPLYFFLQLLFTSSTHFYTSSYLLGLSFPRALRISPFFSLLGEEQWKIGNVLRNVNHPGRRRDGEWGLGVGVADKRRRWMKGQPTCQKSSVPQKCRKAHDILNCFSALYLFTWRVSYITHAQYNIKRHLKNKL